MTKRQAKDTMLSEKLFDYFHQKYGISEAQFEAAVRQCGRVKAKIETYFLVQAHEKKKGK
jgi:hypothetical protein